MGAFVDTRVFSSPEKRGIVAAIMAMYFLSPLISAIAPAMSAVAQDYPEISAAAIGYVLTLTAAFQAVTALATGYVAGRKMNFRTLAIAASIIVIVSGCFPFFLHGGSDFVPLLVSRALLGVGLGIIMPLSNATAMAAFSKEEERSSVVGVGNAMLNLGTIVTNLIGGVLCAISWQTSFLVYLLGILLFIPSAFAMKEPPHFDEMDGARKAGKSRLPGMALVYIILFLISVEFCQPVIVYCSQALAGAGITNPLVTSAMTIAFSIGGIVVSAPFAKVLATFKKRTLPISLLLAAVALAICRIGASPEVANPFVYGVGAFLTGVALLAVTCYTPMALSQVTPPEQLGTAMGLNSFAMAMGTFLVTPFAQLCSALTGESSLLNVYAIAAVLSLVLCIIVAVVMRVRDK